MIRNSHEHPRFRVRYLPLLTGLLALIIYFFTSALGHGNPLLGGSQLAGDFSNQYLSMLNYLHQVVYGHVSAAYSFGNGLGGGMMGNWAYYLLSPFNVITLLFPERLLPIALYIVICLKISFAAGDFTFMAQRAWARLHPALISALALAYALMGYAMIYQREFMWLDALVFLPLIIAGQQKLLAGRGFLLYTLSLAVMLIASYYLGFMICIFLVLFTAYLLVQRVGGKRLVAGLRFVYCSILAAGVAAIVLVPTFMGLIGGKLRVDTGAPILPSLTHPLPMLSRLLIGAIDDHIDLHPGALAVPTVFVGGLVLGLALISFFARRLALRERLAALALSVVLLISCYSGHIYLVWHGGSNPVGYPYRFAFLISFWLVWLAGSTLNAYADEQLDRGPILGVAAVLVLLGAYMFFRRAALGANAARVGLTVIFWLLPLALLLLAGGMRRQLPWLLLLTVGVEMGINAALITNQTRGSALSTYQNYQAEMQKLTGSIHRDAATNSQPYRVEKNFMRGNDRGDGLVYGYGGASIFSSNLPAATPNLLHAWGQMTSGYYIQYTNGTALTDSLLGMRYVIGTRRTQLKTRRDGVQVFGLRSELTGTRIATSGKETVYRNANALPLAFVAASSDVPMRAYQTLQNQERVLQAWSGSKQAVLRPLSVQTQLQGVKQTASAMSSGTQLVNCSRMHGQKHAAITWRVHTTAKQVYLSVPSAYFVKHNRVYVNGKRVQIFPGTPAVVNLGVRPVRGVITVRAKLKTAVSGAAAVTASSVDQTALHKQAVRIQKRGLHFTSSRPSNLAGTVRTRHSATLMTTIPAESGWHVRVDGKTVTPSAALAGTFMRVPLAGSGLHHVRFTYRIPGLRIGAAASLVALVLICYTFLQTNRNPKVRRRRD